MELRPVVGTEYYHTANLWVQGFPPNPFYSSPPLEEGETLTMKAYVMTTVLDRNDSMITFGHILTRLYGSYQDIDHKDIKFDTATSSIEDLQDFEFLNGLLAREVKTYRKLDGSLTSDDLFVFEKAIPSLLLTHFMTGNVIFPKNAIEEGMTWTTNLKNKRDEFTIRVDRAFEANEIETIWTPKNCWDPRYQSENALVSLKLDGESSLKISFDAEPVPPMYVGSLNVVFKLTSHMTLGPDAIVKNLVESYECRLESLFHNVSSTFMHGSLSVELIAKHEPAPMWCGTV